MQGNTFMVKIIINGQQYEVEEGKRLLLILKEKGFKIPNLCFHQALSPAVSCKLCVVEIKEEGKPPRTRLSCAVKTRAGMEVTTESAMVHQLRNSAIGNLLKMAPHSDTIHQIGLEFGLTTGLKPDGCIRCRLCIRVCADIIGARALKMITKERMQYVVPSEEGTCIGCGTCANICPTGAIRSEDNGNIRKILIRNEVIGTHALERCDICSGYYATARFLEHVRTSESSHPAEKEQHHHCSNCAKLYARQKLSITALRLSKTYGGKPDV
jgi:NADH dehydrogenase/NADH:ubiquinone oxidoreductase subunit G